MDLFYILYEKQAEKVKAGEERNWQNERKSAGRKSSIVMDGGTLQIEYNEEDEHVYMTGPAAFVFEGEILLNEKWEI